MEIKGEESELVGRLEGVDNYMNLYIVNTTGYRRGERVRNLGEVVLRGNNVVLIQPEE